MVSRCQPIRRDLHIQSGGRSNGSPERMACPEGPVVCSIVVCEVWCGRREPALLLRLLLAMMQLLNNKAIADGTARKEDLPAKTGQSKKKKIWPKKPCVCVLETGSKAPNPSTCIRIAANEMQAEACIPLPLRGRARARKACRDTPPAKQTYFLHLPASFQLFGTEDATCRRRSEKKMCDCVSTKWPLPYNIAERRRHTVSLQNLPFETEASRIAGSQALAGLLAREQLWAWGRVAGVGRGSWKQGSQADQTTKLERF